ncbi:hypothetical protein KP509_35G060800 [Ceratopteris richardii]|uniref:Uncharacterized protein n=1 Tax=Ceratopteris richardii TaxID=49495 RepID=A0A8T2QHL5_CERRI|nr:hypothetical protein KP509_35G060800 [Ceratopteris richardii]
MASQHSTPTSSAPSASLIGNVFVNRYYNLLHETPHLGHRFYTEESRISRAEPLPETWVETATTLSGIHEKIMSSDYHKMRFEIMTVDSQESTSGRVLVMVTGALYNAAGMRRMFVQTFILVSQEKSYYIYNDIFRFLDGEKVIQKFNPQFAGSTTNPHDSTVTIVKDQGFCKATTVPESPEEIDATASSEPHILKYSSFRESEAVMGSNEHTEPLQLTDVSGSSEDALVEMSASTRIVQGEDEALSSKTIEQHSAMKESKMEMPKKSYASILRLRKEGMKSATPTPSNLNSSKTSSTHEQFSSSSASQENQTAVHSRLTGQQKSLEHAEDPVIAHGDGVSVYVKSLPLNVTMADLETQFSKFGPLKSGGIDLRNQRIGVCYAFIEFEEASSAQRAIEASPINMSGRQVYVEEKRIMLFQGGRGRANQGRGYQTDSLHGRSFYGSGRVLGRGTMDSVRDFSNSRGRGIATTRGAYGTSSLGRLNSQSGITFRPMRRGGSQITRNAPPVRNRMMVAAA